MQNYIKSGDILTLAAPYDRTSGQGALVGTLFGVATMDVLSGKFAEFMTEGVFDLSKLSSDNLTVGLKLYWDDTGKRLTATATSNTLVGHCAVAATASTTTVRVRLTGASG